MFCLYSRMEAVILFGDTLLECKINLQYLHNVAQNEKEDLGNVHLLPEGGMGRKWGVYEKLMRPKGGL